MASGSGITGAQVRMARAFLGWSVADLAQQANVAESTVKRIEQSPDIGEGIETTRDWRESKRGETLAAIATALTGAGVTFLPDDGKHGPGIRGRAKGRK